MMKIFITILLLLTAAFLTDGAKILGVFPVPGRSHYLLGSTLLKALAEKGHDVTMISCFGEKDPPKNGTYRDVVVSGLLKAMQGIFCLRISNLLYEFYKTPLCRIRFLKHDKCSENKSFILSISLHGRSLLPYTPNTLYTKCSCFQCRKLIIRPCPKFRA
jgi:hypothetical protein